MLARHSLLGIALVAGVLATVAGNVLAGDEGERTELRYERDLVRIRDLAVIDRSDALRHVDRLLDAVDDVAEATNSPWRRGVGLLRVEARVPLPADGRERPGAAPVIELHRPAPGAPRVEDRLDAMRRELLELREDLARAPDARRGPLRIVEPMDGREFSLLIGSVRRVRFASDKVAVIGDAAANAYFSASQAADLVREVPSWGQVDAGRLLYPRVIDPQSFHLVYAAMTFSSDRDALRRLIEGRR